jgi:hypothetical protein
MQNVHPSPRRETRISRRWFQGIVSGRGQPRAHGVGA